MCAAVSHHCCSFSFLSLSISPLSLNIVPSVFLSHCLSLFVLCLFLFSQFASSRHISFPLYLPSLTFVALSPSLSLSLSPPCCGALQYSWEECVWIVLCALHFWFLWICLMSVLMYDVTFAIQWGPTVWDHKWKYMCHVIANYIISITIWVKHFI